MSTSSVSGSRGDQADVEVLGEQSVRIPLLLDGAEPLEERGWLTREPDPSNGRYTCAILTDDSLRIVEGAAPGHVDAVRRLVIEPLSEDQLRTLTEIGARLHESIRNTNAP